MTLVYVKVPPKEKLLFVTLILGSSNCLQVGYATQGTMKRLKELLDSLMEGLRFTTYLSEQHQNGRFPMLDVKLWTEEGKERVYKIRHSFYEKLMASPLVFYSRS